MNNPPTETASSGEFSNILKNRLHYMLSEIGDAVSLLGETIYQIFRRPFQLNLLIKQLLLIGFNSLSVVLVSGFFTGMVLGVQGYVQLKPYAVEGSVAQFVSVSVVKELGPMITAFVLSGRIGASITAELSTMKVTEQIDALEVMGTNPVKYLVVPRFLACSIMLPTLTIFSTFAGIFGGFVAVVSLFGFNGYFYVLEVQKHLFVGSVLISLIKATSFGMAIAAVGCYKGFSISTAGGAEGVGIATTGSAVVSLITILVLDFVLNHILFNILGMI
ncbi:ABC transporter permease [Candidatus Poribacteria bacterium]|nr:MAG: ABC transporter permease [Candidatus Poribacteria bacterium]